MASLLLEWNAEVDSHAEGGSTALVGAVNNGDFSMASLLLCEWNANVLYCGKLSALLIAVHKGDMNMVALLLDCDADINQMGDEPSGMESSGNVGLRKGVTALIVAVHNGHINMATLLLKKMANVNETGSDGTALYYAVQYSSTEIVEMLLGARADTTERAYGKGTARELALSTKRVELVDILLTAESEEDNRRRSREDEYEQRKKKIILATAQEEADAREEQLRKKADEATAGMELLQTQLQQMQLQMQALLLYIITYSYSLSLP